ncbi:hypothetical protein JCM12298_14620 [Desulfothermus naphthae]
MGILIKIILFLIFSLNANIVYSLTYYWGVHPDKDRIVFKFNKKIPKDYRVIRNGPLSIELIIPDSIFRQENVPKSKDVKNTLLISKVIVNPSGVIEIKTKNRNFKLSYFELKEENKIVIDVIKQKIINNKELLIPKKKINKYFSENNDSLNIKKERLQPKNTNVKTDINNNLLNGQNNTNEIKNSNLKNNLIKNTINTPGWKIKGKINKNATIYKPNKIFFNDTIQNNVIKNKISYKKQQKILYTYKIRKKINLKINLSQNNILKRKKLEENGTITKRESSIKNANKTKLVQNNLSTKSTPSIESKSQQPSNATSKVDYADKIFQIKLQINNGELETALQDLEILYNDARLPPKYREEVLYYLSDLYFQIYNDKLKENYMKISNILQEAINLFPKSMYLPIWLLKLCYLNIKVGNIEEAKGYFALLKTKFPKSSYVADAYYYWGEYYLFKKDYIHAMESFRTIVEEYQSSKSVKDAAVNLARVLFKLQMYQKSWIVMKYLEQRWPLFYQKDPDILKLAGFIAMYNKKYDTSLEYYWKYYNILAKVEDADMILTRIGDIYLKKGEIPYAKKMYLYVATKYPDKEGGLIAKMRLAEEGIYDEPTVKDMFSVFDRPYNLRPVKIYNEIVTKHPKSPLAPLAQLKLSMWYLWKKNYQDCLKEVKKFYEMFPNSNLKQKAIYVGRVALNSLIQKAIKDNMYSLILSTWYKYDFLHKDLSKIDPSTKIAVAISLWRTGNPAKGLKLANPLIERTDLKEGFLASLELMLNIYLESESWKEIEELGDRFLTDKRLTSNLRSQLKYSYVLAKINLGKGEETLPYLKELALDDNISEKQRGYVFYFLAKQELNREDLEKVYIYAQEALDIFLQRDKNNPNISDCFNMLINVTERAGRTLESIEWALRYKKYLPKDSPLLPSLEYKLADLYLKAGYKERWKKMLSQIKDKYPDTFYGKLASNELKGVSLREQAKKYIQ